MQRWSRNHYHCNIARRHPPKPRKLLSIFFSIILHISPTRGRTIKTQKMCRRGGRRKKEIEHFMAMCGWLLRVGQTAKNLLFKMKMGTFMPKRQCSLRRHTTWKHLNHFDWWHTLEWSTIKKPNFSSVCVEHTLWGNVWGHYWSPRL